MAQMLEILNLPLAPQRLVPRIVSPQIAPVSGARIHLARIEPVLPAWQMDDHTRLPLDFTSISPMQPNIHLNWLSIAIAVFVAFAFGGIYYGPLLGRVWAELMGMKEKPTPAAMRRAMLLQLIGTFLTAYVLTFTLKVWMPSSWSLVGDKPGYVYGFYAGVFTWVGFYVPMQLAKVAWEGRPWKLFLINTVHDLINLQLIAQILARWP